MKLLTLSLLLCTQLIAKNQAKEPTIRKLLRATENWTRPISLFYRNLEEQILQRNDLSPQQKKRILQVLKKRITAKRFEALILPLYAEQYTLSELQEMLRFFSSKTGKKFLRKDPILRKLIQAKGYAYGQQVLAELTKEVNRHPTGTPSKPPNK